MPDEPNWEALKKLAEDSNPRTAEELIEYINDGLPPSGKPKIPLGKGVLSFEYPQIEHPPGFKKGVHYEMDGPLQLPNAKITFIDENNNKSYINNFYDLVEIHNNFNSNIIKDITEHANFYTKLLSVVEGLGQTVLDHSENDMISRELNSNHNYLPVISENNILIFYTLESIPGARLELWKIDWDLNTLEYKKENIVVFIGYIY